jgi:protein O-GlcNAc transferase
MADGLKIAAFLLAAGLAFGEDPAALADRAEQLARSGDSQGALSALDEASQSSITAPELADRIGFLYAVLGQRPQALQYFEKAISINPNFAGAHFHLGVALWQSNDREHGLPELQAAARLEPRSFDYRYRLAGAYLELEEYPAAISELREAVALDGTKASAWEQLGRVLQSTGDPAGAKNAFEHATEADPANDALRNQYAFSLIEVREADRGLDEERKVLAHDPKNVAALMNIGYADLKTGEFAEAEKTYRSALAIDPNASAAHYDLGIALKMQDKIEDAQAEFKEAMRLDPTLAEPIYSLGITYWQLGDFAKAMEQMRAAIAVRPNYAEAHYMLGIILKQNGDLDGALAELRESSRLDPTTPGPYNTLGQILRIKGDKQGSEEAFAKGAQLKREKEAMLSNTLEQGMRGGEAPKPLPGVPH